MRFNLPRLWAALSCIVCCPLPLAAAGTDCRQAGIAQLRAVSPGGYSIFRQTRDTAFFTSWIDCSDAQFDLPTAVHESTHFIAGETDAFPLVGGGTVTRPHLTSGFFAPYRIADRFRADAFTSIYLTKGKASSSTDFLYLLDEFNAYSHDLATAVDLKALAAPDEAVDHRDGLAAMMAFVEAYAAAAETSEPETWNGLRQPQVATTIAALWTRAERVMARSCGIPNFGTEDKAYLGRVCAAGPGSALANILGRAPICPVACLAPVSEAGSADRASLDTGPKMAPVTSGDGETSFETEPDEVTIVRPRHPFARHVGALRHQVGAEVD